MAEIIKVRRFGVAVGWIFKEDWATNEALQMEMYATTSYGYYILIHGMSGLCT